MELLDAAKRVWQAYLNWGPVDDGTPQGIEFEEALGALRQAIRNHDPSWKRNKPTREEEEEEEMRGEIYTRNQLESMENWRATFRHIIAHASPYDRVVCLMKNPGKQPGYFWKMPGMQTVEMMDPISLQKALSDHRLELVRGHLPRGIKVTKPRVTKDKKKKKKVKV